MKTTKIFSVLIFSLLFQFVNFNSKAVASTPEQALATLLKSPSIDPAAISVVVVDLGDGSILASHNPDKGMIPASIMKSATTAALISKDDSNRPLITNVFTDGNIANGVLDGNLIIQASGDPSINADDSRAQSADFVAEIVSALKKKGINEIAGKVIIDESVFSGPATPPSWQSGDLQYAYGTGCHGFNFEQNASAKAAVKNPSEVFRKKLNAAFAKNEIKLAGNSIPEGKRQLLMEHKSAPLNDIMRSCMVRSDNLYAEAFLRMLAIANGKEGSTEKGAETALDYWTKAGLPMEGVVIIDGSGLSRSNKLTGRFMTMMLNKMKGNKNYLDLFARVGTEGTVKNFLKDTKLEGQMALKTGSMKGVQCYAGYKLDENGNPSNSVVIIVNNLKDRDRFRKDLANFFLQIF